MQLKKASLIMFVVMAVAVLGAIPVASQGPEDLTVMPTTLSTVDSLSPALDKESMRAPSGPRPSGPVSIIVTFDESVDAAALAAATGGKVIHTYSLVFNGASLVLDGGKVADIASIPGVTGLYLDKLLQPDTDRSPSFIGARKAWNMGGGQEMAGEGVVVGILDTGVWPEHPSFSDPDPSGKAYDPPPGGPYACEFGNVGWNPNDAPWACNNKLVGAYEFLDTYKAIVGLLPEEFDSARDSDGHGTHTSSTAAGNGQVNASIFGTPWGQVSGIAPRAHVVMYRVCAEEGCYSSDSAAAVEQAAYDGVDVINYSISGGSNPYSDIVSLAFLGAYHNGVLVSASAGNSGPTPDSVAHREPWTITVGASTSPRRFEGKLELKSGAKTLTLKGASVTPGLDTWTPVVSAADYGDEMCLNPFAPGTFDGQIVVCRRGVIARVAKSAHVAEGGAGGFVLYNPVFQGLATDNHFVPGVHLEDAQGARLLDFMAKHPNTLGMIQGGTQREDAAWGDNMAGFSSRGGPKQSLGISKPDVTAPGVQILAGMTPLPGTIVGGKPGELFQSIQGTSMSAPHVTGAAALVKWLQPAWGPGQIKSALMTTAKHNGVSKEDGATTADAFDYGSGRIDLGRAPDAPFTFSATRQQYKYWETSLYRANYPSLYVPVMPGTVTVKRTIHNETNRDLTVVMTPSSKQDVTITVPNKVVVPAGGDAPFWITIDGRDVPMGEVRFSEIDMVTLQKHYHFPVTFVRGEPAVTLEKVCDPGFIKLRRTTECAVTMTNTSFDDANVNMVDRLPSKLDLIEGSTVGGYEFDNTVAWDGVLAGGDALLFIDDTTPAPFGYVSLAGLGVSPVPCPSNCDDGGWVISGLDFNYQGINYDKAIWSVNGTLELGLASGVYSSYANQDLPDAAIPNNIIAPWWTDLNLTDSGNWYLAGLKDGAGTWYTVFEWENVPRYGDATSSFTFQIWLVDGTNKAYVAYDHLTQGASTGGTIGAENYDGTIGDSYYYNGAGTLPVAGASMLVVNDATPGESHTVTFAAEGRVHGAWQNCAEMDTDLLDATSIACFEGWINQ